jgi:hypothetical protein
MDHLSLSRYTQRKVEARVKFASGALAAGLTAGTLHGDEATTEERLFV